MINRIYFLFHLYIYLSDSQKNLGGLYIRVEQTVQQLPRRAFRDAKILLSD